jgi:hypothetical protein
MSIFLITGGLFMPNKKLLSLFIGLIICLLFVSQGMAQLIWRAWEPMGMESDSIWSVRATCSGIYVVAGCQKGLYAAKTIDKKWYVVPLNVSSMVMSIHSIVEFGDKKRIAFIGKVGDLTSMVFIGQIIDAAPYYKITQSLIISGKAQFLALQKTPSNTIYCACTDVIMQSSDSSGIYKPFTKIEGTNGCFGAQKPVCTGLVYSEKIGYLIASGYDSVSRKGVLLNIQNNVVTPFYPAPPQAGDIHVSCMEERMGDWNPQFVSRLFVVNKDTTGYLFDFSKLTWSLWDFFCVKKGTKQVYVVGLGIPTYTFQEGGIFTVSAMLADSGLYCAQTGKKDPAALPVKERRQQCFSLINTNQLTDLLLVCGTNKGVYSMAGKVQFNNISYRQSGDVVTGFYCRYANSLNALVLSGKNIRENLLLKVFNVRGALVYENKNIDFAGNRNVVLPNNNKVSPGTGIYYVSITGVKNNRVFYKEKITVVR